MKLYVLITALVVGSFSLFAQTSIVVFDSKSNTALPNTHVEIQSTSDGNILFSGACNKAGRVTVDKLPIYSDSVLLAISHIGYTTQSHTLKALEPSMSFLLDVSLESLGEVVITGQYAPSNVNDAVQNVRVIDKEKIASMTAVNLEDVLQNELNIRIEQDAQLGSSLSMQGITGQNVKIMIDGVPIIGRQNGNIDLGQINLNTIERVEIIEGPMSVNYGTDALAGTINLITKENLSERYTITAKTYNESVGTYNTSASAIANIKRVNLSGNVSRNFFNGWTPGDALEPNRIQPIADSTRRKTWQPKTQLSGEFRVSLPVQSMRLTSKTSAFTEDILSRGLPVAPYNEIAFDSRFKTRRYDQSFAARGALSDNLKLNALVAYNYYARSKNTFVKDLVTLHEDLVDVASEHDTTEFDTWLSRSSMVYKKDSSWWGIELGYEANVESNRGKRISGGTKTMGDYSVFMTSEIVIADRFTAKPGIRYSYNTVYEAPISPALNLKYAITKALVARASYARGFRAPGLKELYFNFVDINHNIVGNEDLKAEFSHNVSASLSYDHSALKQSNHLEVSGFYNQIDNLISLAIIDLDEQLYGYVNIGEYATAGAKVLYSLKRDQLQFQSGLSYLGARSYFGDETEAPRFDRYPEVVSSASYDFQSIGVRTSAYYKYQGRKPQTSVDESDNLYLTYTEAYQMLDVVLAKQWFNNLINTSIGAKNVFDVQAVNTYSTSGVHSSGSGQRMVGMGRYYFLQIEIKWSK